MLIAEILGAVARYAPDGSSALNQSALQGLAGSRLTGLGRIR
jgi:hypothetical protein